jgi:hypothetical protein
VQGLRYGPLPARALEEQLQGLRQLVNPDGGSQGHLLESDFAAPRVLDRGAERLGRRPGGTAKRIYTFALYTM